MPGRRPPLHPLHRDRLAVLGDPLDRARGARRGGRRDPGRGSRGRRPWRLSPSIRRARSFAIAIVPSRAMTTCALLVRSYALSRSVSAGPADRRAREIRRHDADAVAHRRADDLVEDPPLDVRRAEQVGVRDEHLRLAQHEHAVVVEREVEPAQDPRLRLGVEVHERVAADEQVDPGDRGVLHEVVAAEDHRTPEVAAERVALVGALEEALERLARHVLDRPCRVGAVARGLERLLVDVRRVDLHAIAGTPTRRAPWRRPSRPCRPPRPTRSPRSTRGWRRPAAATRAAAGRRRSRGDPRSPRRGRSP